MHPENVKFQISKLEELNNLPFKEKRRNANRLIAPVVPMHYMDFDNNYFLDLYMGFLSLEKNQKIMVYMTPNLALAGYAVLEIDELNHEDTIMNLRQKPVTSWNQSDKTAISISYDFIRPKEWKSYLFCLFQDGHIELFRGRHILSHYNNGNGKYEITDCDDKVISTDGSISRLFAKKLWEFRAINHPYMQNQSPIPILT